MAGKKKEKIEMDEPVHNARIYIGLDQVGIVDGKSRKDVAETARRIGANWPDEEISVEMLGKKVRLGTYNNFKGL